MSDYSSPYMRRRAKAGSSSHGKASEKRLTHKLGARAQPNSGAMPGAKGDAVLRNPAMPFLLECKSTIHDSMSIQLEWLAKITGEALQKGHNPLLSVSFVQADGRSKLGGEWMMIRTEDFQELLERAGGDQVCAGSKG